MKRAILKMSDNFLMSFLSSTLIKDAFYIEVKDGLPPDVKIIRTGYDEHGDLNLVLESADFEDIVNGNEYPILTPPQFIQRLIDA